MDETDRRFTAFTKEDNRKFQVLQNKVLRLKTGLGRDVSTAELTKASGDLSIQQLTAYHTIMTVFKTLKNEKPNYIYEKFQVCYPNFLHGVFPQRHKNKILLEKNYAKSISRGGFIYRGTQLYNNLPASLRKETKISIFKKELKKWIKSEINVKPL